MSEKRSTPPKENQSSEKKPAPEKRIYDWAEPSAGALRVIIQMVIGFLIAAYVVLSAYNFIPKTVTWNAYRALNYEEETRSLLGAIGYGLVLSAGIDLSYMLFTEDLDEAVNPLIVALSAASIILLSGADFKNSWQTSLALAIMVSAISALFWVRKTFLKKNRSEEWA